MLVLVGATLLNGLAVPVAAQTPANPDALYADRANLSSAAQAFDIWTRELRARPENFDVAWKLARVAYWLGGRGPEAGRRAYLEQGIRAADTARALEPMRPEGHFWAAASMGAIAESAGIRAGLKYRKPIKEALETVMKLDPAFMEGSADRALGRWYHQVPRMFGGNRELAETHLKASLKYDPNSTLSHLFLGELYLDDDRKADARRELQAVLDAPLSAAWGPEDADYKVRARKLLASIK